MGLPSACQSSKGRPSKERALREAGPDGPLRANLGELRKAARRLKQEIGTPLILTGGIRSYEVAAELVESRTADYIGLCRPLIREPNLAKRWETADRRACACVSDNACFKPLGEGRRPPCVRVTQH